MSTADESRAVLGRWYGDMWAQQRWELVPELIGTTYTRHESGGTSEVSAQDYQQLVKSLCEAVEISDLRYHLIAEGHRVAAIGTWKVDGTQWDWVQIFRVHEGRIVETWLSGIVMDSSWGPDAFLPPSGDV